MDRVRRLAKIRKNTIEYTIHDWKDYNSDGKLCCSKCGLTYNEYIKKTYEDAEKG